MRTTKPTIAAIAFGVLFSISPASADPEAIARQSGDHWANCNAEGWLSMRSEDSFIFGPNWKAEGKLALLQPIICKKQLDGSLVYYCSKIDYEVLSR